MKKQQGITLIGAIFILIIVSLLARYLVNISGIQQQTAILQLQSARAEQAANAGLEWTIAKILAQHACPTAFPTHFPDLTGFTVNITCTHLGQANENGRLVHVYQLVSSAHYGHISEADYISRQLEVMIHDTL